jgi:arsenate reductase (thioredoxin)
LPDQWRAFSAGTQPAGFVHPLAIQVLREIGIVHAGESKPVSRFQGVDFDAVITVCDDAAENCPLWLGKGKRAHIGFPDPAQVEGTNAQKLTSFRQVRDDIRKRIIPFLQQLSSREETRPANAG